MWTAIAFVPKFEVDVRLEIFRPKGEFQAYCSLAQPAEPVPHPARMKRHHAVLPPRHSTSPFDQFRLPFDKLPIAGPRLH